MRQKFGSSVSSASRMYNGEALGRRRSIKQRKRAGRERFAGPKLPNPGRALKLARACAVVVALGAAGANIPEAYSGLQGSDLFTLEAISVVGSDLLTPEEVVSRSGLAKGTNLFEANLQSATDSIAAHPIVRSAMLLRRPPDSLVISVEERAPIALLSTPDGLLGFDRDAVSFALPNLPFDLPIVTGVDAVLADSTLSEWMVKHAVVRFIQTAASEQPAFWSGVSEVCLTTPEEGDLILADGTTLKVRLDGIDQQIQNYRAFVASGESLSGDLAYVDLRYENQVVAGRREDAISVATVPGIPD